MAALPAVLAVAAAGASIYGGVAANSAAGQEAKLQKEQGMLQQQNALQNAQIHADEVRKFAAKQKLQFIANGVDFSGSAILTSQDTLDKGQKEVDAMTSQGNAYANLAYKEAGITQAKGRAALIGGFGNAAGTLATAGGQGAFNGLTN